MNPQIKNLISLLPTPLVYHIHHAFHVIAGTAANKPLLQIRHKLPNPPIVAAGPFKGLRYLDHAFSTGSAIAQCLLGTYELEIHPAVEKLCALQPDRIITIGAGEGYYTVGMALRNPQARSIAFEMYKPARYLLGRVARANHVAPRLRIRGACTPQALQSCLAGSRLPVVICDVEGTEDFLMDPLAVPDLKKSHLLIELHDHMCPGVSNRIRDRFASTHDLAEFHTRGRSASDLPPGTHFTPEEIETHILEHRGVPQTWFLLTPKT